MDRLLAQIALDLARERSAEAARRARVHGALHPHHHSLLERGRALAARAAAGLSVGTAAISDAAAGLARRIDACAASKVLVRRESPPAA